MIRVWFFVSCATLLGCSTPIVGADAFSPGPDSPVRADAPETPGDAPEPVLDAPSSDVLVLDAPGGGTDAPPDAGTRIAEWLYWAGSPGQDAFGTDIGESFTGLAPGRPGEIVAAGMAVGAIPALSGAGSAGATGSVLVAAFESDAPTPLWAHAYDATGLDAAYDVTTDSVGNVYVGGVFGGTIDFGGGALGSIGFQDGFLLALDASGARRWDLRLGGGRADGQDYVAAVESTPSGELVAVGVYTTSTNFGGATDFANPLGGVTNAFITWHDPGAAGALVRARAATSATSIAEDVAVASDGSVYVVGEVASIAGTSSATFGGPIVGDADYDAFLAAFGPDGSERGAITFTGASTGSRRCAVAEDDGDLLVSGSNVGGFTAGTINVPAPASATQQAFIARVRWGSTPTVEWVARITSSTGGLAVASRIASRPDGTIVALVTTQGAASYSVVGSGSSTDLLPVHGTAVDLTIIVLRADGSLVSHRRVGARSGGDAATPTRPLGLMTAPAGVYVAGAAARETDAWVDEPVRAANTDPFVWYVPDP